MTEKQKKFAHAYIIYLNATRAAIEAGYSKSTAATIGYENLRKPEIKNYIEESIKKDSLKYEIVKSRLISELIQVGFFCKAKENSVAKMKALEILCKVYGLYEKGHSSDQNQVSDDRKNIISNRLTLYLNKHMNKEIKDDYP